MTFRKPKSGGLRSGSAGNAGTNSLKAKAILTDRGGRVPRFVPAKSPTSKSHPGIFPSGKKARPTGFSHVAPRVIVVGSKNIAPPLSGTSTFF